ncbi:unnamed protein product, partial [Scytosiphon promiscuus]
MEQVFFRLHVRFVSTVTRLLSPKTRRVLEYVTLGNAFLLVVSLTWLHTRFVNPKGGQGSAVSCLPAALERAGVDPAQLHVLQVWTRRRREQARGPCGRRARICFSHHFVLFPSRFVRDPSTGKNQARAAPLCSGLQMSGAPDGCTCLSCLPRTTAVAAAAPSPTGAGKATLRSASGGDPDGSGGGSVAGGDDSPPEFEPPSQPPEIFYSMKLVTGKDAVGTLSGPVTLGIDRKREVIQGGEGRGAIWNAPNTRLPGQEHEAKLDEVSPERVGLRTCILERRKRNLETNILLEHSRSDSNNKYRGNMQRGSQVACVDRRLRSYQLQTWLLLRAGFASVSMSVVTLCRSNCKSAPCALERGKIHEAQRWPCLSQGRILSSGARVQDEVYLYSLEKGFLMLRPDLRRKHGIVTANVTVSAHDSCMGGTVVQTLVKDFIGYDTVVMNWLISLYGGRGFLYGVHNNELFNLNYAAEFIESTEDIGKFLVFKIGVMFTTLFLFFTTTTLVSFTLRETQVTNEIILSSDVLLLFVPPRAAPPPVRPLDLHARRRVARVGILFFLFEFFSDQLLAFMVLSVVWLCEVYSVVSVRTSVCIRFFPQV